MPELTKSQVITKPGYKEGKTYLSTPVKIRRMRRDPTIKLTRLLYFAGIISADWSVEASDSFYEEAIPYIERQMFPLRRHLLSTAALGLFDFGWQPYEKIFTIENGEFSLKKLKPLVQDITELVEDTDTGQFLGFKQEGKELPLEKCLLLNQDVEGTDWKGESTMSAMEMPYDAALKLNGAAERFDEKIAGAHWIIYYPDGNLTFEGEERPASEIADEILACLQSSGSVAVPMGKPQFGDLNLNEPNSQWKIELVAAPGASFPFADRFGYLDKLKVRGAGFPERSILEGEYGTKAEATAHGDFALTMIEYRHDGILEQVNWHLVNQLLRYQFGQEYQNKVFIKAAPLNDQTRAMLSNLYEKILSNPDGFIREVESIDIDAISEQLGIPKIKEDDEDDMPTLIPEGVPS